ncbi:DUF3499 family protein [Rathayibacter toxicus]|uniref:DUF3499 domain-containing protein n=1 Tax=Rathayibacter toxicus TaxID=145458 RepID=A0A2S5Y5K0_9MICO|nr:DUF3499 family protein [Rathayibacter toxicus]ALS57775.1 hypothetical protein APU90_08340 [Rathayibacter toxicus]PPG20947.1 DUF3499 domain-containing protein [Rathayibacter toxicus]PPG46050.1 DUF3499 domain-containing protein [Rathayibacter toxicus]PPH21863.1 DUF3499 domain-containing protein [Rathayibacter toxicus]PPH56385.1 DUF3499 domain-containing protein [Rathayibacter toxicus]
MKGRLCSRTGCGSPAVVTLTYDYCDSLVAIGPLSPAADPHGYDLCAEHDRRLLAPRGWQTLRYGANAASQTPPGAATTR